MLDIILAPKRKKEIRASPNSWPLHLFLYQVSFLSGFKVLFQAKRTLNSDQKANIFYHFYHYYYILKRTLKPDKRKGYYVRAPRIGG